MTNPGRREQIFEVCAYLFNKGYKERHQYTYKKMYDTCESLGYPRGNQQILAKYRDEWLNSHLEEGTDKDQSGISTDSILLQSTLDALLKEHKQKIESELKAVYTTQLDKLKEEKEQLLSTLDLREAELIQTSEKLSVAQDKLDSQEGYFAQLLNENAALSNERANLQSECEGLRSTLAAEKDKNESAIKAMSALKEAKLNGKARLIEQLQAQLDKQEKTNNKLLEEVKVTSMRYKESVKANDELSRQLAEQQNDFHSLKTDFSRQEQTINLLERERGEFYQEFTVMRKQFDQMPKWKKLEEGQGLITKQLEKIVKQGASSKNKKQ